MSQQTEINQEIFIGITEIRVEEFPYFLQAVGHGIAVKVKCFSRSCGVVIMMEICRERFREFRAVGCIIVKQGLQDVHAQYKREMRRLRLAAEKMARQLGQVVHRASLP